MNLSHDQLKQFHDKLISAANPEEAASVAKAFGCEIAPEGAAKLQATVKNGYAELTDEALEKVCGGFGTDSIPQYDIIKDYYKENGANLAFTLCIFYIPSPLCYEIVEVIEDELREEGYVPTTETIAAP